MGQGKPLFWHISQFVFFFWIYFLVMVGTYTPYDIFIAEDGMNNF